MKGKGGREAGQGVHEDEKGTAKQMEEDGGKRKVDDTTR